MNAATDASSHLCVQKSDEYSHSVTKLLVLTNEGT